MYNINKSNSFNINIFFIETRYYGLSLLQTLNRSPEGVRNTDLKVRWTPTQRTVTLAAPAWGGPTSTWRKKKALSSSRGDGQRLFLNLLKVWEWVPWKRSESFWSIFIIMMVSYHMRNSFSCKMRSNWALCCSKVNVRHFTEPICDLRIAKFSHASQFFRLVIEPTQLWAWSGRAYLQELLYKLNIVIFSPLPLH